MNFESIPGKKVFGVCLWLSQLLKADVKIIRILFIIATVISAGTAAIIYILLWAAREFRII